MATQPSSEEIERARAHTEKEIEEKTAAQIAEGKTFNMSADGHGAGVMPEDVWQKHKEQDNG